jgi:hypothetical protein
VGPFKAVGQGFSLTRRLWFALLVVLVVSALFGAVATVSLPFEVDPATGTVRVPEIQTLEQLKTVLGPAMGLYVVSSTVALYLLGGILGGAARLLRNEPVSVRGFLAESNRWLIPMVWWATILSVVVLVLCLAAGLFFGFLWVMSAKQEVMKGVLLFAVMGTFFASFVALIYSPVALVQKGRGAWAALADSVRFFFGRLIGTLGLLLGVVAVGLVAAVANLVLAQVVNGLRQVLGVAPFAKGWPVFVFGLILGIPQAFLTVYFPSVLSAYYHGNQK